jgi:hypothetical protein
MYLIPKHLSLRALAIYVPCMGACVHVQRQEKSEELATQKERLLWQLFSKRLHEHLSVCSQQLLACRAALLFSAFAQCSVLELQRVNALCK